GIPLEAVCELGQRLHRFWERYRSCFKSKTRDTSVYGRHYLSGLLRMETNRNFTQIGRESGVAEQNIQHFMSHSPWSGDGVCEQVQRELKATPALTDGGVLLVDESADEKASDQTAGAAKQYNGRLGKVETSQVGVLLCYVNLKVAQGFWTWVSGKLFLPECWFGEAYQARRQQRGVAGDLKFKTKVELAWDGIQEIIGQGLAFEIVGFDSLYGRSGWLREPLREARKVYLAEVPADTQVYLGKPPRGIPERKSNRGRKPTRVQVLSGEAVRVDSLHEQVNGQRLRVRATERGELCERFAACRVWTVHEARVTQDWLVIREESDNQYSYALCNAPAQTSLEQLAWWKCQRDFIERSNQDAKSELGWDELQAQKYRAWEHHLALTILASWFLAQTKFEWAQHYPRDSALLAESETDVLPALSMANVRELLRAVMPLQRLTEEQAIEHVIEKLTNRTRSRKSKLKKHRLEKQAVIGST
ncbi:MAG: IS701 family transposase, partial [Gammaproteobacteria bacterium]